MGRSWRFHLRILWNGWDAYCAHKTALGTSIGGGAEVVAADEAVSGGGTAQTANEGDEPEKWQQRGEGDREPEGEAEEPGVEGGAAVAEGEAGEFENRGGVGGGGVADGGGLLVDGDGVGGCGP